MKPFSIRARTSQVSAIKRMAALARKVKGAVSLSQGIPSFSTPKHVRQGIAQALMADEPGLGKYSLYMGSKELRQVIVKRLSKEWQKEVDSETNIFVSAGSMQGLMASILALVDPGDEVIVPSPNYGPHFQHIHIAGGRAVTVPMNEGREWTLDVSQVEKAISDKTKLLLFTNPGNPLGNVFDKRTLYSLAGLAKRFDLWVLADETYSYLTYDGIPFVSAATVAGFGKRLIVTRTFSKEYAMTGWRVGFIYGAKEFIAQALKMHDPMVVAASTVSQKAALLAVTGSGQVVSQMVSEIAKRRELFCSLLAKLWPHFTFVKPKGAYYVFAHLSKNLLSKFGPTSEDFALRMLKEAKVAVVPGAHFMPEKDEYVRFSFAGEEEEIKEAITRIKRWLDS